MPNKDFLPAPLFLPCFCNVCVCVEMVVFGEDESSDENSFSTLMGVFPNKGKAKMVKFFFPKER